MRRQYTRRQRSELMDLVAAGQATVPEASARMGVPPSTAYNWLRRERAAVRGLQRRPSPGSKGGEVAEPRFVRLVPSSAVQTAIAVRVGGAEIRVGRDFDADLLRAVVDALGGGEA